MPWKVGAHVRRQELKTSDKRTTWGYAMEGGSTRAPTRSLAPCVPAEFDLTAMRLHPCTLCVIYIGYLSMSKMAGL
jgi:hypothetical protein